MSNLKLEIVTPERAVYSGEANEVTLPGSLGELGVLPGHLPLVTLIKPGELSAYGAGGTRHFAVGSGFAQILPDKISVLVGSCDGSSDIDVENARKNLRELEARIDKADYKTKAELDAAVEEAGRNRARMAIVERATHGKR